MERHEIMHTTLFKPNETNRSNFDLSKKYRTRKQTTISKKQRNYLPQPQPQPQSVATVQPDVELGVEPQVNAAELQIQPTYQVLQSETISQGHELLNNFLQQEQPSFIDLNMNRYGLEHNLLLNQLKNRILKAILGPSQIKRVMIIIKLFSKKKLLH